MPTKRGLGRGLSSLIPNKQKKEDYKFKPVLNEIKSPSVSDLKDVILYINTNNILANPYQPRTKFEKEKLRELSQSIKVHGILNPLIVTSIGDGKYELVSGERRLRAAKDLGLEEVPVIIREVKDQEKLELALIENIQREDLNPIERAFAYKRMLDEFTSLTQESLANRLGISRSEIANTLRFLNLPKVIQNSLASLEISEGHAKVILSIPSDKERINLWKKITVNKLTVRAAEKEAQNIKVKGHIRKVKVKDAYISSIEDKLEELLGTKVSVEGSGNKGKIIIEYYSKDDLDRLIDTLA